MKMVRLVRNGSNIPQTEAIGKTLLNVMFLETFESP